MPSFWDLLFIAIAAMLVVEGLLPLLSPPRWRALFEQVMKMSDGQIRFLGLASIGSGLLLLLIVWP